MQADPDQIIRIGEGFKQVGAYVKPMIENSQERRVMLFEGSGDDDMGKEIYAKLKDSVDKIEAAYGGIVALVDQRHTYTEGLGQRLKAMENNIGENVSNSMSRNNRSGPHR